MSKKLIYTLLVFAFVIAFACWYLLAQGRDKDDQTAAGKTMTVTGCLAKGDSPNEFYLTADDGRKYEVRSDSVQLSEHVGHKVKVTGTSAKESARDEDEDEKAERNERAEHTGGNLQVSKVDHLSETCK